MAGRTYVPPWFDMSKSFNRVEYEPLDSFAMQYAVCKVSESGDYEHCDLYAYMGDKDVVKYGEYYSSSDHYAVVLPPNVYRYSGYDKAAKVIRGENVEDVQRPTDVVDADYVVVEQ